MCVTVMNHVCDSNNVRCISSENNGLIVCKEGVQIASYVYTKYDQ